MSGNKIQEKARITLAKNAKRVNPQKLIEITREILEGIATDGDTIPYGKLAKKLNQEKELKGLNIKPKSELLDAVLTTLSKESNEDEKEKVMLSVVVVLDEKKEENRIPGRGFFKLARELGLLQLARDEGKVATMLRKKQKREFFEKERDKVFAKYKG